MSRNYKIKAAPRKYTKEKFKIAGILMLIFLVLSIFNPLFIITGAFFFITNGIFLLVSFLTDKAVRVRKLRLDDFGLNKDYYREILKEYSPMTLGYIDDFYIGKEEILGTILKLEMTGHISIDDSKRVEILKQNYDGLKLTEQIVMETLIYRGEFEGLEKATIAESEGLGLIEESDSEEKKVARNIAIGFILLLIIFFINASISFSSDFFVKYSFMINIVKASFFYPFFHIGFNIIYGMSAARNPWVRTEKGEELNLKLEGLKNYISDFSMLDEKEVKQLLLWDDYLMYSVIFGHNKVVLKELGDNISVKQKLKDNKYM